MQGISQDDIPNPLNSYDNYGELHNADIDYKLKKNILFVITAIMFSNVAIFAQEENINSTTMLGGMFEVQAPNNKFNNENYGTDLFVKQHFNFLSDNSYLVLNAGYTRYKENNKVRNDYSVTLGAMTIMKSNHSKFSFYNEINLGLLYKKADVYTDANSNFNETSDGSELIIGLNNGVIIHCFKHINLEVTLKFQYDTGEMFHTGIGLGVIYLF